MILYIARDNYGVHVFTRRPHLETLYKCTTCKSKGEKRWTTVKVSAHHPPKRRRRECSLLLFSRNGKVGILGLPGTRLHNFRCIKVRVKGEVLEDWGKEIS